MKRGRETATQPHPEADSQGVSVEVLREAVRQAVADRSAREVARELDASHGWVAKFLDGCEPQQRTVSKLISWYLRTRADAEPDLSTVNAALAVLMRGIHPTLKAKMKSEILESVRTIYAESGAPAPAWAQLSPGSGDDL